MVPSQLNQMKPYHPPIRAIISKKKHKQNNFYQRPYDFLECSTSGPELTGLFEEVTVRVLAGVLDTKVSKLILCLHTVGGNSALRHQLLDEKVPQIHVLDSRAVGPTPGDFQSRCISDIKRYAVEARAESQLLHHAIMFKLSTASFIASAVATSSAFIIDCAVSPCNSTLKLTGAFERKTRYEDIGLPLSGLFPQFASDAVNLKPSCLYVIPKSVVPAR